MAPVSTRSPLLCTSPLIQVHDLCVSYRRGRNSLVALQDVSFHIAPGEIIGVLGESGGGKSTCALAILGLLPSNAHIRGTIRFKNENLSVAQEACLRDIRGATISMVFPEPSLCLSPFMRVGDQVAEVLRAHGVKQRKLRRQRCDEVLKQVGFPNGERIYKAYPHQLSGGELQRIALAQALVCKPDLVIADEATRSLDAKIQSEVLDTLKATNQRCGTAVLFITHNPALLVGFADRVLIMYAGKIVEQGATEQVFRAPLHFYTKELLRLAPGAYERKDRSHVDRFAQIPPTLSTTDEVASAHNLGASCSAKKPVYAGEGPHESAVEHIIP